MRIPTVRCADYSTPVPVRTSPNRWTWSSFEVRWRASWLATLFTPQRKETREHLNEMLLDAIHLAQQVVNVPAGTGRTLNGLTFAAVTHKAGRPFTVRATAVNGAGSPATTTNYTGTPSATSSTATLRRLA
mgnify:CR=1 FL=1